MKQLFTFLLLALFTVSTSAQIVDTVLFENFQVDNSLDWGPVPLGDDITWVSFDEDALNPYDGDDNHRAWYHNEFFYESTDSITGEINYCGTSLSYMEGFAEGNRNWLITPPIQVTGPNFTLHWKSAPFQMPRYMDGYLVLAAKGTNDLFAGAFRDTLFQAASMQAITGTGESVLISNFAFTPGYIHADSLRDEDYTDLWAPGDSALMHGILEPHSVSLAQFAGESVYFAFLHNSDDDYFLAVDDILITNTTVSGTNDLKLSDFRFVTYPNPVVNQLNILYRLPETASVSIRLTDINGRLVMATPAQQQQIGEQQTDLNLSKLPSGVYNLTLQIGEQALSKIFVKK